MSMMITFASTNPGKLREMQAYLENSGLPVSLVLPADYPDVAETGLTFAENALLKAKACPMALGCAYVLAEDSGFEVPALAGCYGLDPFPGVRSHRWMTEAVRRELLGIDASFEERPLDYDQINAGILRLMNRCPNRQAQYKGSIVLLAADGTIAFETVGVVELEVIDDGNPRGDLGFGYDPIVRPAASEIENYPEMRGKTMAELTVQQKNRISHRGKAVEKLIKFLEAESGKKITGNGFPA